MGLRYELRQLLKKHNASIVFNFDDGTDTYGIIGERIEIVDDKTDEVLLSNRGYELSHHDLNE